MAAFSAAHQFGGLLRQRGALVGQRAGALLLLRFQRGGGGGGLRRRWRAGALPSVAIDFRFHPGVHLLAGLFFGQRARQRHFAQLAVDFDARFGGGHDAPFGFAPRFGAGGGHLLDALAVDGGVAQFFFGLQAQVDRLGGDPLRLGLGEGDRLAFLFDVGQRARFFQRARFGHGAGERRGQRDLVGLFALHGQFERFGFGFGQQFGGLARALGLALAFARQRGHAGVGAGDVQHFFLGGVHRGDPFDRLQAGLLGVHFEVFDGARGAFGHLGFRFDLARRRGGVLLLPIWRALRRPA